MSFEFKIASIEDFDELTYNFITSHEITKDTVLVANGFVSLHGIAALSGIAEFRIKGHDELYTAERHLGKDYWCFFVASEVVLND